MLPRLYPILDIDLCRERRLEPLAVLAAFLAGGATLLQLRDKTPATGARARAGRRGGGARARGGRAGDRQRSRRHRAAVGRRRRPRRPGRSAGGRRRGGSSGPMRSSGSRRTTRRRSPRPRATSATYIAVGPIYGTATKDTGYSARGLDLVQARPPDQPGSGPVVAIGGITLERAPEVIAAGAASVAVISDLLRRRPRGDGRGRSSTYNAAYFSQFRTTSRLKGDEWLAHCSGPSPSTA